MASLRASLTKIAPAILVLACLAAGVSLVSAQSSGGCPSGSGCIDPQTFDSLSAVTASGYSVDSRFWQNAQMTISWTDSKSFGMLWWATSGNGLLTTYSSGNGVVLGGIWKTLYLQPGTYKLRLRMASSRTWSLNSDQTINMYAASASDASPVYIGSFTSGSSFQEFSSEAIVVTTPGPVGVGISAAEGGTYYYYDYIYLENYSSSPTATPAAGTPTVTPIAPTGTALPTATAYCIYAPTPTPGAQQFSTTPTATPDTSTKWAMLDKFDSGSLSQDGVWSVAGSGVAYTENTGRSTAGAGAVYIPFSNESGGWSHVTMDRSALIYQHSFTLPFYVNAWASAGYFPAGVTAKIQVWSLDPNHSGAQYWSLVGETSVSSGQWYPFHYEIDAPVSGQVSALAFTAHRDDNALVSGLYLDDVYVYGDLSMAPRCDGTYPTTGLINPTNPSLPLPSSPTTDNTTDVLFVPADKPCPGSIDRPNNFWGYLLSGLTFFMDQVFAETPYHVAGQLQGLMQTIVFSPLLGMFTFLSILFDWTIPLYVLGIMASVWIVYTLLLAWKFARRATVE